MNPVITLVLVADEGGLRLLRNEGVGKGLSEQRVLRREDVPEVETEFSDRPGRSSAGPGMARHGFDPHQTERAQERDLFANAVMIAAEAEWGRGGYDRLIVVAPPRFLGLLRDRMPAGMQAAVTASLDKNLTKVALRDLPDHLSGIASF